MGKLRQFYFLDYMASDVNVLAVFIGRLLSRSDLVMMHNMHKSQRVGLGITTLTSRVRSCELVT